MEGTNPVTTALKCARMQPFNLAHKTWIDFQRGRRLSKVECLTVDLFLRHALGIKSITDFVNRFDQIRRFAQVAKLGAQSFERRSERVW